MSTDERKEDYGEKLRGIEMHPMTTTPRSKNLKRLSESYGVGGNLGLTNADRFGIDSDLARTDQTKLWRRGNSLFNNANKHINDENPGWELIREQKSVDEFEHAVEEGLCNILQVGKFGETVLHYALLFKNEDIAAWLIRHPEHGRTLIKAEYGKSLKNIRIDNTQISDIYQGEGCLHLAVVNRTRKIAKMLLDCREEHKVQCKRLELADFGGEEPKDIGYPLNSQRAVGLFFQGKEPNTVYWGDTALDFAVCSNQIDMVDLLMGYVEEDGKSHATRKSFNKKWRASLMLKDTFYSNTVFHFCALKGYTKMWLCLTRHLEEIFKAKEAKLAKIAVSQINANEIKLKIEKWVRSQVNGFGFTPLQLAAYANHEKMVATILSETRMTIWKWGDKAFFAYTLSEIDDLFENTEITPGIPVLTIILSEGHFELMRLEVLWQLLRQKWTIYGLTWTRVLCIYQGVFVLALTFLFFNCHPDLEDFEADLEDSDTKEPSKWGRMAINTGWEYTCYWFVLIKVIDDIVSMVTEMLILFFNNWNRQKKYQKMNEKVKLGGISMNEVSKDASLSQSKRCWTSFRIMWSLYFETSLHHVPEIIKKVRRKKRDHSSVAGFFLYSRLFSNVAFCVAQLLVLWDSKGTARAFTYLMAPILLIEYLQLLLWLQTNRQVGRFIAAMVTILSKDVMGFMVVLLVIILAYAACFIVLLERSKTEEKWAYLCWMIYELTAGTGEFFKEELDIIVEIDDDSSDEGGRNSIDKYRRTLILITYASYLFLMVVVIMNLLIAVMSQTTESMRAEMPFREKQLKLSSVSLVGRKLRAHHKILCICRKCLSTEESNHQHDENTNQNNVVVEDTNQSCFVNVEQQGGDKHQVGDTKQSKSGGSDQHHKEDQSWVSKCFLWTKKKILEGVKTNGGDRGDQLDIAVVKKLSPELKKYYDQIHYFCALEKEHNEAEQVTGDNFDEIIQLIKKKFISKKRQADELSKEKLLCTIVR